MTSLTAFFQSNAEDSLAESQQDRHNSRTSHASISSNVAVEGSFPHAVITAKTRSSPTLLKLNDASCGHGGDDLCSIAARAMA